MSKHRVDVIEEFTLNAGVTVGGVLLKAAKVTAVALILTTAQVVEAAGVVKVRNLADTADMPISASTLTGTILTAAQPNITSLGTLASLTVNGETVLALTGGRLLVGTSVVGATGVGGIRAAGASIFDSTVLVSGAVTGGTYNGQTISSAAAFTGTASFAGAVTLSSTLAVTGTVAINTAVGSLNTGSKLEVAGTNGPIFKSTGGITLLLWDSVGTGDNVLTNFYTDAGSSLRGSIDYNRAGVAIRYNTTSDARLKERLGEFDGRPILSATKIHSFKWKETGTESFGVFAQEAVQVNPLAVSVGDDGEEVVKQWGVDYSKYVAPLIAGWQNHEARLAALEAKLH